MKITGWVARDENESLYFFYGKPIKSEDIWIDGSFSFLRLKGKSEFNDLTWKDEPIEVELIIKKKDEKYKR